jgi:homoserine kinase type II
MDEPNAAAMIALTSDVAAIWPMTPPARLTSLTTGQNSLVYRVEDSAGAPSILRIYRNHSDLGWVQHETALLAALREAQLPFEVPTPLATRAGALVHQLQLEDRILFDSLAVLWKELPGAHPDPANEEQAHAAGAALALLDLALAAIDPASLSGRATPPYKELRWRASVPDDIEDILLQLPLPAHDTAELLSQLHVVEDQVPRLYDPSQVLMDGTRITAIIDFEFSRSDLRIAELAVPLALWPQDLFGTGAEWGVLEALGRGYTTHLPLLPEEVHALPLLFRLRSIGGLLRDIGWQRQGRVSATRVLWRANYSVQRERWLQQNEARLLAMARQWIQER